MSDQPQGAGLLDGVEAAPAFDMDALIDRVGATPKQQYEGVHVDPEAGLDQGPAPETSAGVAMGIQAKSATAKALMLMLDRAQAGVLTLFGAKGRADDFRFNVRDREEMAGYLEQGIPDNFKLPWYIPFLVLFIVAMAANVAKLQDIKAEARKLEEAEKAKQRQAAKEEQRAIEEEEGAREALRNKRQERQERQRPERTAEPAPSVPAPKSGLTPELRAARDQAKATAKAKEKARQERYNERRRASRAAERAARDEGATDKGDEKE
jgi:flagellar biosynthesis GTPase FlhF